MTEPKARIARADVIAALGVEEELLLTLEREEIIRCEEGCYDAATVERIRICHTLRDELGVNLAGLEIVLNLLDTIEDQRRQFGEVLTWVQSQLIDRR